MKIDDVLAGGKRGLRTHPASCLLGSTGARLWADMLDTAPGFSGTLDFIHKLNIPRLYSIRASVDIHYEIADVRWYPSHLHLRCDGSGIVFEEKKFIAWEDCAVSCQTWTNRGPHPVTLRLIPGENLLQETDGSKWTGTFDAEKYGFRIVSSLTASDLRLLNGLDVLPGETVSFVVAIAMGVEGMDELALLASRAEAFTGVSTEEALQRHVREYERWFEKAPAFASSDPLLDKTWAYRWYLVRRNLANPRLGNLQYPLFYEGRSHKMTKSPLNPSGWEFSKMIPLTAPMHVLEARWYDDADLTNGVLANMRASQDERGLYRCLFVNQTLHSYANFMGWAAYQLFLVRRDAESARAILPSLKKQVTGEREALGNEADELIIERIHQHTGKEYQPSYWYFHDYPLDCRDPATYTPLKRVDRSVYHYLNCLGVARLCRALGDEEAERFDELADGIKRDILAKMWVDDEQFFFDLHHETDEPALVKNIVGFYPYWAGITEEEHADGMKLLFDERFFATPQPFPSVAADCPVYQPEGGWRGIFIKGRNGCVWDGPAWPYTNSIALDALAEESRRKGHAYDDRFGAFLRSFSLMHYAQRDLSRPYLVEHYNSQTGEAISDEVDYFHSYYIDLIVRHVAGLRLEERRIVLDPIDVGLSHFKLERLSIAGRRIDISYNDGSLPGATDAPIGLVLWIDGRAAVSRTELGRLEYPF